MDNSSAQQQKDSMPFVLKQEAIGDNQSPSLVQQDQTVPVTTLPGHLYEHCYSKFPPDVSELMDTVPPTEAPSEERAGLTLLNQQQDTFEAILLELLKTFTRSQRQSVDDKSPIETPSLSQSGLTPGIDISAESLNTLSPEQVMTLVTSNSVNYEVIERIRAQKLGLTPKNSKSAKPTEIAKTEANSDINPQLLQVSHEQLMQLQSQITELLAQRKVTIPVDMPPEKQMELIHSLLTMQLNESQTVNESTSATPEPTPTTAKKQNKSSSPAKSSSSKQGSAGGRRRREPAKKEPKKPPKPYNIFFGEVYSTVMAANPKMSLTESSKIISNMWEAMGDDIKKRYSEAHQKMEEEYQKAMEDFQSSRQPSEKPATLQQLLATSTDLPKVSPPVVTSPSPGSPSPVPPEEGLGTPTTEAASMVVGESEQLAPDLTTQNEVTTEKVLNSEVSKQPGSCLSMGCTNMAIFAEDRGPDYCSSECVVRHCRNVFDAWVSNRKTSRV